MSVSAQGVEAKGGGGDEAFGSSNEFPRTAEFTKRLPQHGTALTGQTQGLPWIGGEVRLFRPGKLAKGAVVATRRRDRLKRFLFVDNMHRRSAHRHEQDDAKAFVKLLFQHTHAARR